MTSPCFQQPHGLFFIDRETLIVTNRIGSAVLVKVPTRDKSSRRVEVSAVRTITGDQSRQVESPGSVSVFPLGNDLHEVLICNNYVHCITRHVLDAAANFDVTENEVLLREGLNIPDGVAVNPEGRWIAISNHNGHEVMLFDKRRQLSSDSEPDGILQYINYPHGVRFTADDAHVLVADAGSPFVHVFAKGEQSWAGTREPITSIQAVGIETYLRGRYNPCEGGPKGIDVDTEMQVLVATAEHQTLAFFDLPSELRRSRSVVNPALKESVA